MFVRSFPVLLMCLVPMLACGPKKPPPTTPEPEPEVEAPPPVDPIPADFGALTPQIVVPDIQAALDFYGPAFGAETMSTFPAPEGGLMHAEIKIGDSVIMIDPARPEMKDPMALGGSPVTLMLYVEDADAAFDAAVQAGAVVNMPLEDQFWGDRYGQLIDPFGHAWAVATHIEDLTDDQLKERMGLLPRRPRRARSPRSPRRAKSPSGRRSRAPRPPRRSPPGTTRSPCR